MAYNLDGFFAAAREQVQKFDDWAGRFVPPTIADHICFKCGSVAEFESWRAAFEKQSAFIYQSPIAGRRIAIVKFLAPLATTLGDIWYLELSDQKPDGSQTSGFDHIEIFPKSGTMEELAADLEEKGVAFEKVIRPHHTTFDGIIAGTFKIRLEPEALIEKIMRDEMPTGESEKTKAAVNSAA